MEAVLAALQTLYSDPNNAAKAQANSWLQTFQKEVRSYRVASKITGSLKSDLIHHRSGMAAARSLGNSKPDTRQYRRACRAQAVCCSDFQDKGTLSRTASPSTCKQVAYDPSYFFNLLKIIYDLDQLPAEHRLPLRDTLIHALKNATSGPKAIITQLCIALADLLLQIREWSNGLQEMIDQLGSSPESVAALLEFLTVLPQEMARENRIRIDVRAIFSHYCFLAE